MPINQNSGDFTSYVSTVNFEPEVIFFRRGWPSTSQRELNSKPEIDEEQEPTQVSLLGKYPSYICRILE